MQQIWSDTCFAISAATTVSNVKQNRRKQQPTKSKNTTKNRTNYQHQKQTTKCRCFQSPRHNARRGKNQKVRCKGPQTANGVGKMYHTVLGGGTYYRVYPPKPLLEASESGICQVSAHFLREMTGRGKRRVAAPLT